MINVCTYSKHTALYPGYVALNPKSSASARFPFLYILNPTRSGAFGAACGSIFFDPNKFSDMALRLCIIAALVAFAFGACPFAKLNGPCPHASLLSAQADVQLSAEWGGSDPKPDVGQVLPLPLCLRPPLPPPRRAARKAAFRSMPNCRKPSRGARANPSASPPSLTSMLATVATRATAVGLRPWTPSASPESACLDLVSLPQQRSDSGACYLDFLSAGTTTASIQPTTRSSRRAPHRFAMQCPTRRLSSVCFV